MANRYWRGGTGTWNTTNTANWSATSGGAGGASVPTSADSVFFDQAGTYTVTLSGTSLTCLNITVSAGTVTFASSGTLYIYGSMSLISGMTWSATGQVLFYSTTTGNIIQTNGVSIGGSITFNGAGGDWTLGSSITTRGTCQFLAGTLTTNGFSIFCYNAFQSTGTQVRTLNLGASTIQVGISVSGTLVSLTTTNLTLNAGTSRFYCNLAGGTLSFDFGGATINDFEVSNLNSGSTVQIASSNTFRNFTVAGSNTTGSGYVNVVFGAKQTINGVLSTTSTSGNNRVFFASGTYGNCVDLVVNAAPSLTDADFRGLYVTGTAAPISGTRIGNRGLCRGITFSAPKTVYWNLAGTQNWSANGWAATSGGAFSSSNFPLPQDTAVFDNASAITNIVLDATIGYVPTVNMSARTSAMTVSVSNNTTVYGNWINGAGVFLTGSFTLTFSGDTTQTITSAGITFLNPITVDTYGGTVQLADALSISVYTLTVTNGTFDTRGYAVTAGVLSSNNSNVRAINLRASTVSLSSSTPIVFTTFDNLTFNAGTSTILISNFNMVFNGAGLTYYNVSFTNTLSSITTYIFNANTFNNLTLAAPSSNGIINYSFDASQTINGTLFCSGASAVRRIFLQSSINDAQRELTVGTLSATDCDFRDIKILGAASGASPTRAGDCGGNSGITFPAPKTVYWNLAGAQNWSATAWATSSGGAPAINNFPLAQDTAVFDNTGAVTGTISIDNAWNIGTFDASARTNAMTLAFSGSPLIYLDWKFGTGVTVSQSANLVYFYTAGTSTITSNGVQFTVGIYIYRPSGTVRLADALTLSSNKTINFAAGSFDAVSYNVTAGAASLGGSGCTVRMGSGTWTLSATGSVWSVGAGSTLYVGTSTIVLSDTSTTARSFDGLGLYYNKLTIGGTTGTSTLTFTGANVFGELASTKTVAHTIVFPSSTTTTIGKWSVTGTVGNVVTLAPSTASTAYTINILGPATSGINYLSVSYCTAGGFGEFYVGANSTNTAGNTGSIFFTATPAPRTLYWVGGTGNWSSTTQWSTSSGGASGAAVPTSLDNVIFDSLSGATSYTATVNTGVTTPRCAAITVGNPASGTLSIAGSAAIAFHGNVSFAAGISVSYTGVISLCGFNNSYTFTANGTSFSSTFSFRGIGSTWSLGSALSVASNTVTVEYGTLVTNNFAFTCYRLDFNAISPRAVRGASFGSSTVTITALLNPTALNLSSPVNLTFDAGTSFINLTGGGGSNSSGIGAPSSGLTFYDVMFSGTVAFTVTGANTFHLLSFNGRPTLGSTVATFSANQTIGTLALNPGATPAYRTLLASDTLGTQRTLSVGALSFGAADYDFRDIAVTGAAAPLTGSRFGDCKGNSGITFDAPKTVYYAYGSTGGSWGTATTGVWSFTVGGAQNAYAFPLAQDTAVFPAAYPVSTGSVSLNASYSIGTIDMSARTANTMTLATGTNSFSIYGNWINGTGVTQTGTGTVNFIGRGSQQITSAGAAFSQPINIYSPGGSVTLQDAFVSSFAGVALTLTQGTFNANIYNVTFSSSSGSISITGTGARTLACGSGTWTFASTSPVSVGTVTNTTVTGTGTITMTSGSAKTFAGGGLSYSGITLNQGGGGALTITGNNTFKDITNTYSATSAGTISLGNTTQTVTQFTGTGTAGKILTLSGTSGASPATLILTSGTVTTPNYLSISYVKAYSLSNTWYAGSNSTNGGSLGWIFAAYVPSGTVNYGGFFPFFS